MRLTWKDAVTTLFVAAIVAIHVTFLNGTSLWLISSTRGTTAAVLVLGFVGGCALSAPGGVRATAFRAPCPSVTSRRGHSPCRWPTSRKVTATAPAKSQTHDPVAGARKETPMTILAIGVGHETIRAWTNWLLPYPRTGGAPKSPIC